MCPAWDDEGRAGARAVQAREVEREERMEVEETSTDESLPERTSPGGAAVGRVASETGV